MSARTCEDCRAALGAGLKWWWADVEGFTRQPFRAATRSKARYQAALKLKDAGYAETIGEAFMRIRITRCHEELS